MANDRLKQLASRSDIALAVALVGVLIVMVIPIPRFLIDLLLAGSISAALLVVLVSLYVERPLDFSVFPTLLLLVTLYRLSLNVATTRLILLHGHEGTDAAGKLIQAFGQFVVGGNYAVGMVIFIVLVVINFVVITKGAGRIAEVAARFMLDSMPGKQMSIDADLNAGLIDEEEARARRREISREADFYGAMDGASKFVRGDAIAGIVITLINILGGFFIGVVQRGLSVGQAAQNYTLLTIGDGLVSQIPALIVSTAAGVVVSRASGEAELARDFSRQLFGRDKVLLLAAGFLAFFALVPGLPTVPFLVLSSLAAFVGVSIRRSGTGAEQEGQKPAEPSEISVEDLIQTDLVELELGYGLVPLVDATKGGMLLEKIANLRAQLAHRMGFVIPPIHIRDNLDLKSGQYRVLIKGNEVATAELWPDRLLAIDPGTVKESVEGIPARDPTFGLPAVWI
ncbi:MAG TPA: flagellar type III secretion system protein FlhA, partial [Proteobacteria bacterium]|nr:flagellar type III secretion system protein FlhA [Pseudomonadota bacterium]